MTDEGRAEGERQWQDCKHEVTTRLSQAGEYGSTNLTDWYWCSTCGALRLVDSSDWTKPANGTPNLEAEVAKAQRWREALQRIAQGEDRPYSYARRVLDETETRAALADSPVTETAKERRYREVLERIAAQGNARPRWTAEESIVLARAALADEDGEVKHGS